MKKIKTKEINKYGVTNVLLPRSVLLLNELFFSYTYIKEHSSQRTLNAAICIYDRHPNNIKTTTINGVVYGYWLYSTIYTWLNDISNVQTRYMNGNVFIYKKGIYYNNGFPCHVRISVNDIQDIQSKYRKFLHFDGKEVIYKA